MNEINDQFNKFPHKNELLNSFKNKPFLSIGSEFSVPELYNILTKNPYLVNTEDEYNETFLSYAIKRNNNDIINLILTSPILNLTYQNEISGNTYLHLAVIQQNIKLIRELLNKNIYIDTQNNDGNTALHLAYYVNNINIIKLLLENNIDLAIKNKKGLIAEEIDPVDNINDIAGYEVNDEYNINKKNGNGLNLNNSSETKFKSSSKTKSENALKEKNSNNNSYKEDKVKAISNGLDYIYQNKNESIDKKEEISQFYNNTYTNVDKNNNEIDNLQTINNDFPFYETQEEEEIENEEGKEKDSFEIGKEYNLSTIHPQTLNDDDNKINDDNSKREEKIIDCDNKSLFEFLFQINMQKYYDNLNNNGFEDINIIIEDTKLGNYLTDTQLKMIGIINPGDRAKILIRLEEKSNLFEFTIPKNVYYYINNIENCENDLNVMKLNNWLINIKLEQYLKNFLNCGYYSVELLLIQSLSKNPLNEDILKNEFYIEKLGHRTRILNKLKEEGKKYIKNLRESIVTFHNEEDSKICSECSIF